MKRSLKNSKRKSRKPRDKWQWKHDPKPIGCSKSSFKREVYSNTIQSYLKKQEKSHINNLTLILKELEKEEQKTPKLAEVKK